MDKYDEGDNSTRADESKEDHRPIDDTQLRRKDKEPRQEGMKIFIYKSSVTKEPVVREIENELRHVQRFIEETCSDEVKKKVPQRDGKG